MITFASGYDSFLLRKIFGNSNVLISGHGIDMLIGIMNNMIQKGAPVEYDDIGLSKYNFEQMLNILKRVQTLQDGSKAMTEQDVISAVNSLSKYRSAQIPNYQEMVSAVENDILVSKGEKTEDEVSPSSPPENPSQQKTENKLEYLGLDKYGKIIIKIPGGYDLKLARGINEIIRAFCIANKIMPETDQFGKYDYPMWKFVNKKAGLNCIGINKSILSQTLKFLESKGFKSPENLSLSQDGSVIAKEESGKEVNLSKKKIFVINEIQMYGKEYLILDIPYGGYTVGLNQVFKQNGLWGNNGIKYQPETRKYAVYKNVLQKIKSVIESTVKELDTSDLDKFIPSGAIIEEVEKNNLKDLSVSALTLDTPLILDGIEYPVRQISISGSNKSDTSIINEGIKYIFPSYPKERWYNKSKWQYELFGDSNQYKILIQYLKKMDFDTKGLEHEVASLMSQDIIENVKMEGDFGEYMTVDNFKGSIEKDNPNISISLRDKQKDGTSFLYSRDSAILADETGGGKTLQAIVAANMRIKDGNILIITLKATQLQWVKEIIRVIGEDNYDQISIDIMNPSRWTICYYHQFSHPKNRDLYKQSIMDGNFGGLIFDELHCIKHRTSKRSQVLEEISKVIPVKWGLTATPVSNVPLDVKNQLKLIGHRMGDISESAFRKDFCGMVLSTVKTPYGIKTVWQDGGPESTMQAAQKLNKWLLLTGVMIKRTKKEMREGMPMSIENVIPVMVDTNKCEKMANQLISSYKDPNLAISKMLARRSSLAVHKVPFSCEKALSLVEGGEKMIIFSCFKESQNELFTYLSEAVKEIDPNYYVLQFTSEIKSDQLQKNVDVFKSDPNAKIFVMSLKMAGTGVDFPNICNHMIINDYDWTPESKVQSEGRILRINSNEDVNIHYIVDVSFTVRKFVGMVTDQNGNQIPQYEQVVFDNKLFEKLKKKNEIAEIIQKYNQELSSKPTVDLESKIKELIKQSAQLDEDIHGFMDCFSETNSKTANSKIGVKMNIKAQIRNDSHPPIQKVDPPITLDELYDLDWEQYEFLNGDAEEREATFEYRAIDQHGREWSTVARADYMGGGSYQIDKSSFDGFELARPSTKLPRISNKETKIKLSKSQWEQIGKIAGWNDAFDRAQERYDNMTPESGIAVYCDKCKMFLDEVYFCRECGKYISRDETTTDGSGMMRCDYCQEIIVDEQKAEYKVDWEGIYYCNICGRKATPEDS